MSELLQKYYLFECGIETYSKKYNTPEIWLIYPINEEVRTMPQLSFETVKDEQTRESVNVFFVDLGDYEASLMSLYNKVYLNTQESVL